MPDRIIVKIENRCLWVEKAEALDLWHICEAGGGLDFSRLFRFPRGIWILQGPFCPLFDNGGGEPHAHLIDEDRALRLLLESQHGIPEDLQEQANRLHLLNETMAPIRKRRAVGRNRAR